MAQKQPFLIGAHMSIAGGAYKAIQRGADIGCTAIQVFTRSNRQWAFDTDYQQETIDTFNKVLDKTQVAEVVSHASYLVNLASPNADTEEKSIKALAAELSRCGKLGIPYVVLHPGSYLDADKETAIKQVAQHIDTIMKDAPSNVWLLLENMAGQGSSLGRTFQELNAICENLSTTKQIGFCFDTCHAFAAGYDFATEEAYENMWQEFDTYLDLNRLKTIHFNDSKKEKGSTVDRHEHIGKGAMGLEPFRLLMNDERFFTTPKLLETPKDNIPDDDVENLKTLYSLLSNQHKETIAVNFPTM